MNIGMILEAPFPPDVRVEKEAKSLSGAGHTVIILAIKANDDLLFEEVDGYFIYRFDLAKHHVLKNLTRDYRQLRFIDPLWKKEINTFVKQHEIDVLHVHDLPLVKTALKIGEKQRIPVIVDYHENYPAQIEAFNKPGMSVRKKYYRSYKRWAALEESVSSSVEHIITVAQEYKKHVINVHGIPESKITIVQNVFDMQSAHDTVQVIKKSINQYIISYVGSYGSHRGLDVVVQAMPVILEHIPNARFEIIGRGRIKKELLALANDYNVSNAVRIFDWMRYDKIVEHFYQADIGVIPHHASEHTNTTIPNKLFEYMYYKVPLLVSDLPPLKRIVLETGAGVYFNAGDPADFARQVLEIHDKPNTYGENGHKAVIGKYNWNNEAKKLINLYNKI